MNLFEKFKVPLILKESLSFSSSLKALRPERSRDEFYTESPLHSLLECAKRKGHSALLEHQLLPKLQSLGFQR